MTIYFQEYMNRLQILHREIKKTFADLPQKALDWVPGQEMNSMTVLITHLAGAQRYWIGDMAGQIDSNRVRAAEFESAGQDAASLTTMLDDLEQFCADVLDSLTIADLDNVFESVSHNGRSFSVAWSLGHAIDHSHEHLGHLQLLRQLWEQQS
ncbi:MAG: DUF664 domain-containing protein [Chloroflexi bacterium]|nr:DUF664 domain-containing protein [Chloroflexota bacterium]